ncbi:hypothetical protein [Rhizobium sp. Leaf311]|uniref:hypothetical protein n=1 Tax=Rhizobium sp. Leaf311 TaxID=1736332 RepID=UPI000786A48C|nr:hypothetical protein [Rhizobium sp. Leaf311]
MKITFSIDGKGANCRWSVDAIYDSGFGGPVAKDPYGNYYFYLTRHEDGRLHTSGTMLSNCGPQPIDQYFTSDAQGLVDNREVFDHNGSAMTVAPRRGNHRLSRSQKIDIEHRQGWRGTFQSQRAIGPLRR